jgi:serine/threonine protein kinase
VGKIQSFATNILEAIEYIHKNGAIHTDVKLENILTVTNEVEEEFPVAKLCDFGLSLPIDRSTEAAYMQVKCGTFGYMAPEVKSVRTQNT